MKFIAISVAVPSGALATCKKLLLVMKLTVLLLIIAIVHVSATTSAQKVTLTATNAPLTNVFNEIRNQTGYDFLFTESTLKDAKNVNISVQDAELRTVLEKIFEGQPLSFTIENNAIIISKKEPSLLDKLVAVIESIDVKGRAVDETGQPLAGATVIVKGGTNSTITDAKGNFALKHVDASAIIVISYVGYDKKEVKAEEDLGVIRLTLSTNKLDQVHVIAYGQTSQRLSTGNISGVSAEDIEKQPISNTLMALEGKVPGLVITQTSGIPGSPIKVQIQGQNSIANGNDPLYVIDGVPYDPTFNNANDGSNTSLAFINPYDIQSVEVLKDASATAIYGSRAANGAILITTKKGKAGATKVDINLQDGFARDTRMIPMQNTAQFLAMRQEAYRNDGAIPSSNPSDPTYAPDLTLYSQTRYTDWQKTLYGKTAQYFNADGSVSGGNENTQFLISGGYHRETAVFPGDYRNLTGSVHVNLNNSSANKKFRIQFSANYTTNDNNFNSGPTTLRFQPNAPAIYNPDGSLNWAENQQGTTTWLDGVQPLQYTLFQTDTKTNNLGASATLSYQLLPGLNLSTAFGFNSQNSNQVGTDPLSALPPEQRPYAQNAATFVQSTFTTYSVEPQINFKRTISKGVLEVLLGESIQQQNGANQGMYSTGFTSELQIRDPGSAPESFVYSGSYAYRYNGVFSRINYNWDDKYVLDLTARRDGSSRFGQKNQFHDFGAVGVAWIFSQENFFKNNFSFISTGKLKASYGVTGNDQIGNYQYLSLYYPTGLYQGNKVIYPNGLANPYLEWEVNKKASVGLDLGFLNDRLVFSFNYARNRSSNQLLGYNLPITAGFGSITENFPAMVQNTSMEFMVNTRNIEGKDFRWSTSLNVTIPHNKLLSFPNLATSSYANYLIVGQPVGIAKTQHYLGVDPATGLYVFEDKKGNPTYNVTYPDDNYVLVNPLPQAYGGMENTFNYKGFALSFLINFRIQTAYGNATPIFGGFGSYYQSTQPLSVLPEWQQPGQVRAVGRYFNYLNTPTDIAALNQVAILWGSDAPFLDGSWLRLQNVNLSWQMPEKWCPKIGMKSLKFFAQGENLMILTRYKGLDPEAQIITGVPPLLVLTFGLKATL